MKRVYLLWHTHTFQGWDRRRKANGVYESENAAQEAQARVAGQRGFRDQPEGFEIAAYELGQDHWTGGYVTMIDETE